jgi:hypothetical protein
VSFVRAHHQPDLPVEFLLAILILVQHRMLLAVGVWVARDSSRHRTRGRERATDDRAGPAAGSRDMIGRGGMHASSGARLTIEDRDALAYAKELLENPGLAAKIANLAGLPLEQAVRRLPRKWAAAVDSATTRSLQLALEAALATVDSQGKASSWDRLHKLLVATTGAAGGAFGIAGLPVELPVSTIIMLRGIADVARSEGERLETADAKLACIEVFALGGRSSTDDADESAYFAVRAALGKSVSDAARYLAGKGMLRRGAPAIVRLISQVASRFGIVVTEKVAAQAVPLIGAAGGATINLLFMAHFQEMARGHFIVRRLERKYGPDVVRRAYREL